MNNNHIMGSINVWFECKTCGWVDDLTTYYIRVQCILFNCSMHIDCELQKWTFTHICLSSAQIETDIVENADNDWTQTWGKQLEYWTHCCSSAITVDKSFPISDANLLKMKIDWKLENENINRFDFDFALIIIM